MTANIAWLTRLARAAERAERLAGTAECPCHHGGISPHTARGARAARLRALCHAQLRAWHDASRWSGMGPGPEDHPALARRLAGR